MEPSRYVCPSNVVLTLSVTGPRLHRGADSRLLGSVGIGGNAVTRSATGSRAQVFEYLLVQPAGGADRFETEGSVTEPTALQEPFYDACIAIRRVLRAKRLVSPMFRSASAELGEVHEHGVLLELDQKPGVWVIGRLFQAVRAANDPDEFYVICEDGTPDGVIELGFAMLLGRAP